MILTFKSFIASTHVQKHVRQREKHCTVHTIQLLHDLEGCSKFVLYKVGGFIISTVPKPPCFRCMRAYTILIVGISGGGLSVINRK